MIARTHRLKNGMKKLCRGFMTDRAGNIALSFAVVAVPLLGAMGAGIDYMRAMNLHREMQANLDAALVAAVMDLGTKDEAALKTQMTNWLAAEASNSGSYSLDMTSVVIDSTNSKITAKVKANVSTTFLRMLGKKTIPVAVKASVAGGQTITKSAFSMYLVLDHSGSMADPTNTTYTTTCSGGVKCTKRYTKMESLKLAVGSLVTQFNTADPNKKYVRTAAVAYDDKMETPTPMAWGADHALTYVKALMPDGLTDSSGAMAEAYNKLKDSTGSGSEDVIHKNKNGLKPEKYIVLMTDGENTKMQGYRIVDNPSADANTKSTCDSAKKAGIKIYSVAFMAPDRGQQLLKYCSSGAEYYFDVENTSEIVAAFESIGEKSSKNLVKLTN